MKTKFFAVCAFISSLFAVSCGDLDNHELAVVYPAQGYRILYADHTCDSICFVTFDSWRVRPHDEWIRLTGKESGTIKYDNSKRYLISSELEFAPNTTNQTRIGTVEVNSYDYAVGAKYIQFGHLEITHPVAMVDSLRPESTIPHSVSFCLRDSAFVLADSLCFDVHNVWTLKCKDGEQLPSWITLGKTSGNSGKNSVALTFQENMELTPRSTVLTLTSGRVTNEIKIEQLGRKKKENEQ